MSRRAKPRARYGDGCIYHQGKSPIWWISWYEPTRQPDGTIKRQRHYASTHSDDRQVAQRALRAKLQAVGGRRPSVVNPQKVSYEDLRENFFQYLIMKGRPSLEMNAKGEPKVNTIARLDKFFGGWRAGDISIVDLKRFRIEGKRDGLSDQRLNRYIATIRKMFNQALKDELITRAEVPSYFPTTYEPNVAVGAIYIKREWYTGLRKVLKEPLRSAFTLAWYAATRPGELRKIRWRDVNIKERVVTLPAEITKTGKTRIVPLPKDFDRKHGQPDELVFPLGDCRERWRTACVKVGAGYYECRECKVRCEGRVCPTHGKLPTKKLRYHGAQLKNCRPTANRRMAEAGLDEKRRMEISGHTTTAMSQRYNIGREGDVARARDAMDKFHQAGL